MLERINPDPGAAPQQLSEDRTSYPPLRLVTSPNRPVRPMPDTNPTYFGAVVRSPEGDARIMCMAQETPDHRSIHYFKVDTSMDDMAYQFGGGAEQFAENLRGTGLAVKVMDDSGRPIEDLVHDHLREAYGAQAQIETKQIPRPSLVSLFL